MLRGRSFVIEEFERNKPGACQLKYYVPWVGDVRVGQSCRKAYRAGASGAAPMDNALIQPANARLHLLRRC
jgi:hypothetical protein